MLDLISAALTASGTPTLKPSDDGVAVHNFAHLVAFSSLTASCRTGKTSNTRSQCCDPERRRFDRTVGPTGGESGADPDRRESPYDRSAGGDWGQCGTVIGHGIERGYCHHHAQNE